MKYSEACHLKAIIDSAIANLERKVVEDSITGASRKRLVAAHVRFPFLNCPENSLKKGQQCNRVELEGRAYEMSWDWDAEDIDLDEDDERMWVPITPKTLKDEVT